MRLFVLGRPRPRLGLLDEERKKDKKKNPFKETLSSNEAGVLEILRRSSCPLPGDDGYHSVRSRMEYSWRLVPQEPPRMIRSFIAITLKPGPGSGRHHKYPLET